MNANASPKLAEAFAIALLLVALVFGGGSRGVGDAIVHCAAALAFPVVMLRTRHVDWSGLNLVVAAMFVGVLLVLVLQCLPLPFNVWRSLPANAELGGTLAAADIQQNAHPMTSDLWGTVRSTLWLMTGSVMWLLLAGLPPKSRLRWLQAAVICSVLMTLLGYAQAMAGSGGGLQFHEFQNTSSATGTFANRNHFASLMGMMSVLAIGLAQVARSKEQRHAVVWAVAAVLLMLGAAVSFSRTGFVLAAFGFMLAIALAWKARRAQPDKSAGWGGILAAAGALALAGVGTYAWQRLVDRFDHDPMADARFEYWANGQRVFEALAPWGSGAGSFRTIYGRMEPLSELSNTYALHAHNDYLEVAIELGWPGIALITASVISMLCLLAVAWKARHDGRLPRLWIGLSLCLPIIHSVADYPLRTSAIWVVACGLVAILPARKIPTTDSVATS